MTTGDRVVRPRPGPPPDGAEELLPLPVHRLVMEWPEMYAALAREGVSLERMGGRPLGDLEEARTLAERLVRSAEWRRP